MIVKRGTFVVIIETILAGEETNSEIIVASFIIDNSSNKSVYHRTFQPTKRLPKILICTTEMQNTEMGVIIAARRVGVGGHPEAVMAEGILISTGM